MKFNIVATAQTMAANDAQEEKMHYLRHALEIKKQTKIGYYNISYTEIIPIFQR